VIGAIVVECGAGLFWGPSPFFLESKIPRATITLGCLSF